MLCTFFPVATAFCGDGAFIMNYQEVMPQMQVLID
jgi:thiamine pyrophosphate-dependent acetolactate synthase large subunit-like protein